MEHQQTQASCKSVFKSGENTPLKKQFTKKWIELIKKTKGQLPASGNDKPFSVWYNAYRKRLVLSLRRCEL